jgi:hypothetical protein
LENIATAPESTMNSEITFEEFLKGLAKWIEKTTTSPSGRHLGHYKLLHKLNVWDEEDNKINKSIKILQVIYNILMTSIYLGRPLERWKEVTTCMIKKVPNVSRIDRLRVIYIYEANYNLLLKVIWARKTIWKSYQDKKINDGQSGSKPGCWAINVALQKELKYNYSRLTRTPLITIDNDAKSCFDRI